MANRRRKIGLIHATVKHRHVVTVADESLNDVAADEASSTQDNDPHSSEYQLVRIASPQRGLGQCSGMTLTTERERRFDSIRRLAIGARAVSGLSDEDELAARAVGGVSHIRD
jgi:hypothetical protein